MSETEETLAWELASHILSVIRWNESGLIPSVEFWEKKILPFVQRAKCLALTEQRGVTETVPEFFKKWRKSKVFDSLDDNLKICVEDAWEFAEAYASSRLAEVTAQKDELIQRGKVIADHLLWALDLLDMYDRRMVQLGDPKELVYSAIHVNRKSSARGELEGYWQALRKESNCSYCRDGNIPLAGWHSYASGNELCVHTEGGR